MPGRILEWNNEAMWRYEWYWSLLFQNAITIARNASLHNEMNVLLVSLSSWELLTLNWILLSDTRYRVKITSLVLEIKAVVLANKCVLLALLKTIVFCAVITSVQKMENAHKHYSLTRSARDLNSVLNVRRVNACRALMGFSSSRTKVGAKKKDVILSLFHRRLQCLTIMRWLLLSRLSWIPRYLSSFWLSNIN
jgi:hypothetical protein